MGSQQSNPQPSSCARQIDPVSLMVIGDCFRSLKCETPKVAHVFIFQPPIVPKVEHAGDSTNFETYPEEDWQSSQDLPESVLEKFNEF